MNTSIYKLASPKIAGGAIYLRYRAGLLRGIDVADAQPTPEQLTFLLNVLPVQEARLTNGEVNLGTMKVVPLPERLAKDKIAHFCAAFQEYRKVSYRPTQNECSNIRTVPVNAELLTVFFETPLMDYSIRNYIARINVTRDVQKNGRDLKKRFPKGYDADFYSKCDGPTLVEYKKYLRENGWIYHSQRGWVEADKV
jgi:hypothetical protein